MMSFDVTIKKVDDVYMRVEAERSTLQEIADIFTFMVPGAKFMPAFKARYWDGKARLLNIQTGMIYSGLLSQVKDFLDLRGYTYNVDGRLEEINDDVDDAFCVSFIQKVNPKHQPRDYQYEAFKHCVTQKRCVLLSPTGSGKSLIIYLITRLFEMQKKRVLIVVPTVSLTMQMNSDFKDYNHGTDLDTHLITAGVDKMTDAAVTITTWQSIFKMPAQWFSQFDCVIVDECHQAKSKSLSGIMEKCKNISYKFGLTGTLDNENVNKMVLTGLFGEPHRVATTQDLMEKNQLANLQIRCMVLKYPDEDKKRNHKHTYQEEIDLIVASEARNRFVVNLVKHLKGNTLVLFRYVEKHGKVLYELINKEVENCHYISGEVDKEVREEIRHLVETQDSAVICASVQTMGTGVNIKRIHNIVFVSPSKSKVSTLQSIGRGLRLSDDKEECVLYDIVDDLRYKSKENYTLKHFRERVQMYDAEGFNYKLYDYSL